MVNRIYGLVCAFVRIHRRAVVLENSVRGQHLVNPMAVKDALKLLENQSDYACAVAFKELPPAAMDLLAIAGEKIGKPLRKSMAQWPLYPRGAVLMHVPKRSDVEPLIAAV